MQTNTANIYAAGDIVSFPLSVYGDRMVSIGHWQLAHTQGFYLLLNSLFEL